MRSRDEELGAHAQISPVYMHVDWILLLSQFSLTTKLALSDEPLGDVFNLVWHRLNSFSM
jgi:hypothetical protein